jgi:photosystem I P700 chlorophyll a apoprotein A1
MVFSHLWCKAGHFSVALSKGAKTTTWIWNLHSGAHDFWMQSGSPALMTRKVFSSGLAHLSLVFFWLGGMHFHAAYFANTSAWNKDPKHCLPSAQTVSSLVGQDILNSDVGGYFQGINITSGFFQLWRSQGIVSEIHLKYACVASIGGTIICMGGSYFHMHVAGPCRKGLQMPLSIHGLFLLLGLACMSWSGHQIHISLPINRLLDSGVDPAVIPWPQDLLFRDSLQVIVPLRSGITTGALAEVNIQSFVGSVSTMEGLLNSSAEHHFLIALVLIGSGLIAYTNCTRVSHNFTNDFGVRPLNAELSLNLLFAGQASIVFAHHIYAMPVYPYLASDYPTVLSLFCHHINIGCLLIIGASAHASIGIIRDFLPRRITLFHIWIEVLNHRGIVIAHLIYLSVALGLHSFGLYIHNDTLQALGRSEDIFADNSIRFKAVFAASGVSQRPCFDIEVLDGKLTTLRQELGTADFMVHHIHAFTIHVTLLILFKGFLYARSSRLVSDKLELGYSYPCDGPGRGGTCQISPYDHLYLALFWMYNSLSVVLFHYFWKMQSDVWGSYSNQKISHISGGDFSVTSCTINGWLRNFLWSQAAQVIQSYGTSISAYGLIFLCTHFVWAFSLMFLYSGRGYWQELCESILWAHHRLKIVNVISPRALSISQGRAVALTHYILGGIGTTWAFVLSRIIALS